MLCNVALGIATLPETSHPSRLLRKRVSLEFPGVLLFTVLGFLVMGYHPGLEDDGIYLAAVKANLNPALFPYNSNFFRLQLEATQFDRWMADFVRWTRTPLEWAELLWQLAAIFLILWAVKKIADHLFSAETAAWSSVALVAAMFTLPVSGTALYMVDQHLHPRSLATAAILLAVWKIVDRRYWQAVPLLIVAFLLHPLMAVLGISFCIFLTVTLRASMRTDIRSLRASAVAFVPLGWVVVLPAPFGPSKPTTSPREIRRLTSRTTCLRL